MTRKLPLVPTVLVALAVAVLIGLGVWQLRRAEWKQALIEQYEAASALPPITFPTSPIANDQLPLFRHATGNCLRPVSKRAIAGQNRAGDTGYVQIVECVTGAEGPGMSVELGWSKNPNAAFVWNGGLVSGVIAPDSRTRMRLVAASSPQGLKPSAPPSVEQIPITPAGHRGYAATWFGIAIVAITVYFFALRQRWRKEAANG
ncbi:MAG: SURF1 family protein [Sphingomicrobium sp.]